MSGKFDQLQRDVPYAAVLQALRSLLRQILTAPEAELEAWRSAMQEALTPNAQVVIDVLPELELIIGEQPAPPILAPSEARVRFNMVLTRFVSVIAGAEHPLVLFLDDLQWVDPGSLELMKKVLVDVDCHHLMVIGAYRDNEVAAGHPCSRHSRSYGTPTRRLRPSSCNRSRRSTSVSFSRIRSLETSWRWSR